MFKNKIFKKKLFIFLKSVVQQKVKTVKKKKERFKTALLKNILQNGFVIFYFSSFQNL